MTSTIDESKKALQKLADWYENVSLKTLKSKKSKWDYYGSDILEELIGFGT